MSALEHRGYQGAATYEDGTFLIRLLHIEDLITTNCEMASKVEETFRELVDDYIETCEQMGRAPQKPFKGSFNVRMKPDLHRLIAMAATRAGETLNGWVVKAAEERLSKCRVLKLQQVNLEYVEKLVENLKTLEWSSPEQVGISQFMQAVPRAGIERFQDLSVNQVRERAKSLGREYH